MSIKVAKSAGFCFGVNRAVELVEKAAGEGENVATLGLSFTITMRWLILKPWAFG